MVEEGYGHNDPFVIFDENITELTFANAFQCFIWFIWSNHIMYLKAYNTDISEEMHQMLFFLTFFVSFSIVQILIGIEITS